MKRYTFVFVLALFLLLGACSSPTNAPSAVSGPYPMTLTNVLGEEFVLEKEPERLITLDPSTTETLYAIGAGDKVVARNDYDEYPLEALKKPSVGDMMDPSQEAIVAATPDLVFASNFLFNEQVQKIVDTGVPVFTVSEQFTVEAVMENIKNIGRIVNRTENAEAVVETMKETLLQVKEATEGREKVSVYYVVGFGEGGDYTATGETFIHDMLTLAGGDNIAGDVEGWSYNLETLLQRDPQVILVSTEWDTKSHFMAEEGYQDLTAVKNGQVYEVDTDLMQVHGPRVALGVLEIAKILHPELFTP